MSLPRVVVDNSAVLPAFFPETETVQFDGGLVTSRSQSLMHAIRLRRVEAFVPPSFFREFLNVATQPLFQPGKKNPAIAEHIRQQWDDLLTLPLVVVPVNEIKHYCAALVFDELCPAADAWYVAAAMHAQAEFWVSHDHRDGLAAVAARFVEVKLLSKQTPAY